MSISWLALVRIRLVVSYRVNRVEWNSGEKIAEVGIRTTPPEPDFWRHGMAKYESGLFMAQT